MLFALAAMLVLVDVALRRRRRIVGRVVGARRFSTGDGR
jgi:hypothetical protein